MTKLEARAWVRKHWQTMMRNLDCPDTSELTDEESMEIFAVWAEESERLAERLEPRR